MPIAEDIKKFYPDDWAEIRERVLERATIDPGELPLKKQAWVRHLLSKPTPCCEWCGKPNGQPVYSFKNGWEWLIDDDKGRPATWISVSNEGELQDLKHLDDLDDYSDDEDRDLTRDIIMGFLLTRGETKTVLTIAHLDHDPRGDDLDRLRALCQRCHLTYDNQPKQRAMRRRIYAELRGQQTLLEDV